jgi:hypothetical protein
LEAFEKATSSHTPLSFEEELSFDPTFPQAWPGLTEVESLQANAGQDASQEANLELPALAGMRMASWASFGDYQKVDPPMDLANDYLPVDGTRSTPARFIGDLTSIDEVMLDLQPLQVPRSTNFQNQGFLTPGTSNAIPVRGSKFSLPAYLPQLPIAPNAKFEKESWTAEQDNLLFILRRSGMPFAEIVKAMQDQLGTEVSENRLVKRFGKIRESYLDVSSSIWFPCGCPKKGVIVSKPRG